jgi:hypothetical protein
MIRSSENAPISGLVQMDVERLSVALAKPEDRVEMALGIAVDRAGIEPADDLAAGLHRRIHQFQRARPAQQAGLREGDEFDIDDVPPGVARRQDALDAPEPVLGVDIDMAADMGRAEDRGLHGLTRRLARGFDVEPLLVHPLVVDLVEQLRADLVHIPGHPQHGLVEMRVSLDQPWQDDLGPALLDRGTGRRRDALPHPHDPAAFDEDIDRRPAIGANIAQQQGARHQIQILSHAAASPTGLCRRDGDSPHVTPIACNTIPPLHAIKSGEQGPAVRRQAPPRPLQHEPGHHRLALESTRFCGNP